VKRILVIEDDPDIARLLELNLGDLGFHVSQEGDGAAGLQRTREEDFDLVVLDIMLPGMDGFDVCRKIREKDRQIPILVLSALSDEVDKVVGLELGADAYVTKPFGIRELVAGIKAIFRRIEVDQEADQSIGDAVLESGPLSLNRSSRTASLNRRPLELTTKEFDLLSTFMQNPGRAFSRQELLEQVWGYEYPGYSHTVNSHINRLRRKIEEDPANPTLITTVWGIGYRFGGETAQNR
jgi:DNA-binding response OmpR family regulator